MRRLTLPLSAIFLFAGCRGDTPVKAEDLEDPLTSVPHARDLVRRYKPKEIGMPLYPGAVVEYYENDFIMLGKALEARAALRTTDGMDRVVDFYRRAFRERYGLPTYEYESPTYYMAEKRRDSSTTFPFFVVAVADKGSYRRITLHRLPGYDNVNGEGNVRTSIRFR